MTFCTIGQLFSGYASFHVTFENLSRLVVVTTIAGVFHIVFDMAQLAFRIAITAMVQREVMDAQSGRRPGSICVAVLALQSKKAGMNFGLFVACHTFAWRALEFISVMALLALEFFVSAGNDKKVVMIEAVHPVHAVMTIQTGNPKLILVLGHKSGVTRVILVTGDTNLKINIFQITLVAVFAHHGLFIEIHLVKHQAETGSLLVFKRRTFQVCRRPGAGAMAGRAVGVKHASMSFWLGVTACTGG